MKQLFLLAGVFSAGVVFAQTPKYNVSEYLLKKLKSNKSGLIQKQDQPQVFASPNVYVILPNGNKVITLSQDNMPCIVPDMSQFNMPNYADKKFNPAFHFDPNAIPNPALPGPAIPLTILPEKKNK
jgi:hypothetical protein